ncbi:MAG: PIN domain-containing protein [Nitrospirae bacterium]|nr:PIN domain-containing protein [Nitrospirota bacterium]
MMSLEVIFVDASAWIALADRDDANHKKAAAVYPSLLTENIRLITSNFVIAETYIVLLKELGHAAAISFLERVKTSPRITRVYSTEDLESEAQTMLGKYRDQDFSYADAVSFTIMKRQKIIKAFAYDKHFLSAGFIVVS